MPSSAKNYDEIYRVQDKVLQVLSGHFGIFHLTGGTALGRFYLNHRNSDDLDLFTNQNPEFINSAGAIRNILEKHFDVSKEKIILYPDFMRVWIADDVDLKVEIVNDVVGRWGTPVYAGEIPVDTVCNILANKLNAMVGRDEPKDVFDIVSIASNFNFNWAEVFKYVIQKAIVSEPDVLMRMRTFPVEMLKERDWLKHPVDLPSFKDKLDRIADDFLLARDNSLGAGKAPIQDARPPAQALGSGF